MFTHLRTTSAARATATAPRRSRRLLVGLSVAAALIAGAAPAVAGSAPAAPGAVNADACPFTAALCLFDGENYTGERFNVSSLVPEGTCVSLVEHGWGDRARSAINSHTKSAAMFMNDGCVGDPYQVPAGAGLSSLGSFRPASVWIAG